VLNTKLRIPGLLASILTQIALYSINLRVMGSPNISLLRIDTLFTRVRDWAFRTAGHAGPGAGLHRGRHRPDVLVLRH
jgi:putative ABC transport system permease protein